MRLAGIVLVTALLVIPGTTAGLLSRRLGRVLCYSWLIGMIGVVGGLIVSVEVGRLSTGPCIVAVLCTNSRSPIYSAADKPAASAAA